jgi:phage FluMu protein Com
MIKFDCTKCGHSYNVSEEYAGKRVRCKECKEINTIPSVELDTDHSGDSLDAYNCLLQELSECEKNAPTTEIEN